MHERPRDLPPRRGGAAGITVVLAGCLLAGCTASPPADPEPTATPSLTQEQQDDRAFRDVFTRYVSLAPSEETEEVLSGMLTGDALAGELSSVRDTQQKDQHAEGKAMASAFEVTSRGSDDKGDFMVAQACLDVSGIRVLDATGKDVTPTRDTRLSLQMKATKAADGSWRISDSLRNESVHACA
ncbi:hypothetical protein [Clavibacter capsici]|uniref:hypothetical protein n=1 Tax=Clavibacter capsici TaxID=1874630 RepID=UPI0014287205|nr:hypothetical protein [Clavibacter capsici]QIS39543.1 hypothetical protein GW572_10330 [Clavibacter capsici]